MTPKITWNGQNREETLPVWLTAGEGTLCIADGTLSQPGGVLVQLTDPELEGGQDADVWPSQAGCVTAWTAPERSTRVGCVTVTVQNARLQGDIYNASGYRDHSPTRLELVLGRGAVLEGAVSATESRLGPEGVEHQSFSNGGNEVSVTLTDGAVWTPEGAGYLTSLTVGRGCRLSAMVLVDDCMVSIQKGKTYEGLILILPQ